MPVKVHTAAAQKVDDTTDYVATLKSRDSAVVSPQVEGIITRFSSTPANTLPTALP